MPLKDSGAAHSLLCAMDKPEGRLDRVGAINLATPETGELGDGDHFSAIAMRNSGIRPRPLDVGNLNRGLLVWWCGGLSMRLVGERMYVRKCVRMHKCPHVSTDM